MIKKLLLVILMGSGSTPVFSQGTVSFCNSNAAVGLDAPIYGYDGMGGVYKVGGQYTVELLTGPALNDMSLQAATGLSPETPGYFDGRGVSIPNVGAGSEAWCVVQVFANTFPTFAEAFASQLGGSCGASAPFRVVTGGAGIPPSAPAPLAGLTSIFLGLQIFEEPIPRLDLYKSSTNTVTLGWGSPYPLEPGVNYWRYVLQQSADLVPSHWISVTNAPEFDGARMRVTIPAPSGVVFYRLLRHL